jgi:flagellin
LDEDENTKALYIQYKDNDFETHAGKELDIKLQIGANDSESMNLLIGVVDAAYLGIARKADHKGIISTAGVDAEAGISVLTAEDANNAIGFFDNALRIVSESRSRLGAYQNRLEHTINNLATAAENLTAAESRIRDVDMALEMSEFTKNSIINQAATAMLAQANQLPQGILNLLQ